MDTHLICRSATYLFILFTFFFFFSKSSQFAITSIISLLHLEFQGLQDESQQISLLLKKEKQETSLQCSFPRPQEVDEFPTVQRAETEI